MTFRFAVGAIALVVSATISGAVPCRADDDPIGPINENQVVQMLRSQGLEGEVIQQIVTSLKSKGAGPVAQGEKPVTAIQLGSVLFSHGLNKAFFQDTDNWNFTAGINYKGRLAKIRDLYEITYKNGGFKAELAYKWMWIFLPKNIPFETLDGAVFGGSVKGRGIAISTSVVTKSPLQIEGGWVELKNGVGNAYILAMKVGVSASNLLGMQLGNTQYKLSFPEIMFPELEIRQKLLLPF